MTGEDLEGQADFRKKPRGAGRDTWVSGTPKDRCVPRCVSPKNATPAGDFRQLRQPRSEVTNLFPERHKPLIRQRQPPSHPYTDPELLHPEDLIWPVGINNFRISYQAGF